MPHKTPTHKTKYQRTKNKKYSELTIVKHDNKCVHRNRIEKKPSKKYDDERHSSKHISRHTPRHTSRKHHPSQKHNTVQKHNDTIQTYALTRRQNKKPYKYCEDETEYDSPVFVIDEEHCN